MCTRVDPMAYPRDDPMFATKVVIDACRPWDRRTAFPHVATATPAARSEVLARWADRLGFDTTDLQEER